MVTSLYVWIYRIYSFFHRSGTEGVLRRWPLAARCLDRLKHNSRQYLRTRVAVWVQIESGISKGLWFHIWLPGEVALWRGEHDSEVQKAIAAALQPGAV